MHTIFIALASALLLLGAAAARSEGDPPGHACWDLGDQKAAECYRAYAVWAAKGADEALLPFLNHLRTDRRSDALGDERDLVAAAIEVHELAQRDMEAFCALSVKTQNLVGARRDWVRDACRMAMMHERTRQLVSDLEQSRDETVVIYGAAWREAEPSKTCAADILECWAACETERMALGEARLADAFAELGDPEAEAAFAAYAEAECRLLENLTRGGSRQTKALTYAPCKAGAAEGRLAELLTLISFR